MNAQTTETSWFRHREQGTLHEAAKGSEAYRRLLSERTIVDEEAGDVPEAVFERISASEVKKATDNPEKNPGYLAPRAPRSRKGGTTIINEVASAGPSDEEIQTRIEDAVSSAIAELVAALKDEKAKSDAEAEATAKTEQPATTDPKGK